MNAMKKLLALLLAAMMLLGVVAAAEGTAEAGVDGQLISEGMMDIQYAKGFSIEMFQGGYRIINDLLSGGRILVVPEGMSVLADLDDDIQVLQLPVTNAYICGTNVVAMCNAIGAIDKVTLVGSKSRYHFDSVNAQLDSGYTQFAGGYTTDADYELIATAGTQVAVWNGDDEEVIQKFRDLGIVILCEENTTEPSLYGRMEWWKCLGVLLGVEEQANAYFESQVEQIEAIRAEGDAGVVAGMGYLSASSNNYSARRSGDFQADYIRYAGGTYNLQDVEPDKGGSLKMTAEDFYLRFKDIDLMVWYGSVDDLDELEELYPSIVDFKAYQNNRIYVCSDSYIQHGAANPAQIVADTHTILTSDDPAVVTQYYSQLTHAADSAN